MHTAALAAEVSGSATASEEAADGRLATLPAALVEVLQMEATDTLVAALPSLCRTPSVLRTVIVAALPQPHFVAQLTATLTASPSLLASVPRMLHGNSGAALLSQVCHAACAESKQLVEHAAAATAAAIGDSDGEGDSSPRGTPSRAAGRTTSR